MNLQIRDSAYGGEGYKPLPIVRLIFKFPAAVVASVLVLFIIIAGGMFRNTLVHTAVFYPSSLNQPTLSALELERLVCSSGALWKKKKKRKKHALLSYFSP